ncbi:hypothetical protein E2C01_056006 [Portunus trituberculatus]|uniref:Uncharacterized protein n=1 Tax=Portunus trituberculatus TaxID=210409 RepID=A0A5B7GWQ5_PORTR|nr:hypothetical protein [Portunus trituberculatus]
MCGGTLDTVFVKLKYSEESVGGRAIGPELLVSNGKSSAIPSPAPPDPGDRAPLPRPSLTHRRPRNDRLTLKP